MSVPGRKGAFLGDSCMWLLMGQLHGWAARVWALFTICANNQLL
jgi:hypothetical protein